MAETVFIYALQDPGTLGIKYVGMTNNPARRYASHLRKPVNKLVGEWLGDLKRRGLEPDMVILDQAPRRRAAELERNMIWLFCVMGGNQILNGGTRRKFYQHVSERGMSIEAPYLKCKCGALFALEDSPPKDTLYKLDNPVPGKPEILVCGACGDAIKPEQVTRFINWHDWWYS